MMIGKIHQFGRRQLHTIISREIIKPSSPTPSHLQTYNLSQLDQCIPHIYSPLILIYPNNKHCSLTPNEKVREMKKSLSQSLTRYYPFAGRLQTPTTTYVDCNDEGVVFVESIHDSHLDKGQHISEQDDTIGQLFADGMVWHNSPHSTSLVGVQINHFSCGGMAVAVSISHRIGDVCTLISFASHWASVTRYGSTDHKLVLPINPHFIQSPSTDSLPPETSVLTPSFANRVTRKFVFPNSKLSDLKNKVEAGSINNPTRVQVLTSLIYKTIATSTNSRSSYFRQSFLFIPVNVRNVFNPKLPQTTVGNFVMSLLVATRHKSETSLSYVVSAIKKAKMELEQAQSLQEASENYNLFLSSLGEEDLETFVTRAFLCSSLCGFPYYEVDFGWGKPTVANVTLGSSDRTGAVMMDTPNGDGIVARVTLETEDMEIFQNDNELLSFCQNN